MFISLLAIFALAICTDASRSVSYASSRPRHRLPTSTACFAAGTPSRPLSPEDQRIRAKILNRRGDHFDLNPFAGKIEFGATSVLRTRLDGADAPSVAAWLRDPAAVAGSIWDDKTLLDGADLWRLNVMRLQFVSLALAPTVDVRMYTEERERGPAFVVQSRGFDPNVEILGMGVDAASLGIEIRVCGELRAAGDGSGLEGRIGFMTSGLLPPPMRLLPPPALKAASGVINGQIMNFAKRSFEKGARAEYEKFRQSNSIKPKM
uniref:START domain-containing protein n=1 Tax=Corethron hystrix TaxID=216773 RepID=A0A7S1FQZ3_9STRA